MDIYEKIRQGKWVEAGRNKHYHKQPDGVYIHDGYALYRSGKLIDRLDTKEEAIELRKMLGKPEEVHIVPYGGGKVTPEMLRVALDLPDTFEGLEKAIESFHTIMKMILKMI